MRDRYAFAQLTALPMAATLILHLALIGFVILRWSPDTRVRTVEARVLPPRAISATLIDVSAVQPASTPPPRAAPPRQAAPKPDPRPATRAAAAEPRVESTPRRDPEPRASRPVRRPTAARPEPPQARKSAQEWAAIGRAELAAALDREDSVAGAVTAEEMSASYAASIRDTVESYWSAPPSARNGMEALLAIQLVPTGELVSVSVLRSSGSAAFDRSALNAVEKAAAFPELRNLPRREFERRFRRFQLLFRPETLRY